MIHTHALCAALSLALLAVPLSVEAKTTGQPSAEEIAWARDVLQRYLDEQSTPPEPPELPAEIASTAQAMLAQRLQSSGPPTAPKGSVVPPPVLRVNGVLQAHDLQAIAIPPDFNGDVISVGGGITVPAGMTSPRITVTDFTPELIDVPVYSLRATSPATVTVCKAGPGCDDVPNPTAAGITEVAKLRTINGVSIVPGGLLVLGGDSAHGSGGSGYFNVPSAFDANVDNNPSRCFGRPAIGVRLWETDANQIGIQIKCAK